MTTQETAPLSQYLQPVLAHPKLLVVVTLLTLGLGVGAGSAMPKTYVSSTSVLVYPVDPDPSSVLASDENRVDMATEIRLATSTAVTSSASELLAAQAINLSTGRPGCRRRRLEPQGLEHPRHLLRRGIAGRGPGRRRRSGRCLRRLSGRAGEQHQGCRRTGHHRPHRRPDPASQRPQPGGHRVGAGRVGGAAVDLGRPFDPGRRRHHRGRSSPAADRPPWFERLAAGRRFAGRRSRAGRDGRLRRRCGASDGGLRCRRGRPVDDERRSLPRRTGTGHRSPRAIDRHCGRTGPTDRAGPTGRNQPHPNRPSRFTEPRHRTGPTDRARSPADTAPAATVPAAVIAEPALAVAAVEQTLGPDETVEVAPAQDLEDERSATIRQAVADYERGHEPRGWHRPTIDDVGQ